VQAYIEVTPVDVVKYEVDKTTGYLRVDRPQRGASASPMLYGFIPRTYCDRRVGELCPGANGGDGDPLDICVLSERPVDRADILLDARVLGGLQVLDHGEADDKIVAVLKGDRIWGGAKDLADLPDALIERLKHYFSTYKLVPGDESEPPLIVQLAYGAEHARSVVLAAMADYEEQYGS